MIDTVKAWCKSVDSDDKRFFLSMLAGLILWWAFIGRKKYSTKGMR